MAVLSLWYSRTNRFPDIANHTDLMVVCWRTSFRRLNHHGTKKPYQNSGSETSMRYKSWARKRARAPKFYARVSPSSCVRVPNSVGMDPVRYVLWSHNQARFCLRLEIAVLIVPDSCVSYSRREMRLVNWYIESGIVPCSLVRCKLSDCRFDNWFKKDGSFICSRGLSNHQNSSKSWRRTISSGK